MLASLTALPTARVALLATERRSATSQPGSAVVSLIESIPADTVVVPE